MLNKKEIENLEKVIEDIILPLINENSYYLDNILLENKELDRSITEEVSCLLKDL